MDRNDNMGKNKFWKQRKKTKQKTEMDRFFSEKPQNSSKSLRQTPTDIIGRKHCLKLIKEGSSKKLLRVHQKNSGKSKDIEPKVKDD